MNALLQVRGLRKTFGDLIAVDSVSLELDEGRTLGVVGESGSGKSTLARCILRATEPDEGSIRFLGRDGWANLEQLGHRDMIPLRREMQMIFQDPFASLNPRMTIRQIVEEPLIIHGSCAPAARLARVRQMLDLVGLAGDSLTRYPHAFSGGQRQRISIARALILRPRLLICDECVSALDVAVQAQILNLLRDLQAEMSMALLFITHDLSVVRHICDSVMVMYRGRVVEQSSAATLFSHPAHDYTRLLLSSIPSVDPDQPLQPLDRSSLKLANHDST